MARKPMVTRSITSTTVKALCVDVTNSNTHEETLELAGKFKKETDLLKAVKEQLENNELIVAKITSKEEKTELRGMPEQTFVELSFALPPRGTKTENLFETK